MDTEAYKTLSPEQKLVIDAYEAGWNAAIDKCIEVANKYDSYGPAYEMKTLKK